MGHEAASDQSDSADEQNQHHERVEKAGRLKIDVQISDHAGKDEERAANREQPSDLAAAAEKEDGNTKEQRYEGDAETVCTPQIPVRTLNAYLIRQQIAANAGHNESDQKLAHAAGRTTHIV